ncbi:MAG: hypothetical protein A2729_00940 [Candidatus Buchananbacteria bacterium RIFCSPHIGHO2_01_FULL_39_14]|uniref:DUF4325 domain-containing protein n=2 Tax=Candidatus Buchananiibacteriota TaxID=1817903 RepID=A0A1G1YWM3_9BACT|nr:MAG: hypothetical protein A2729_00940 [Candidatus Buchananbacteria bacterium RIFCSPHIGHO2_01_FULL_39_14]OGY49523.1 MAG: hypothetical protein A3D39_00210 [Candidatus Buchananbacteria bacterium RIFCSPHIGHO2_02_FULL_39_17]OGY56000.1 MAG: hypothetical protein A2912_03420 [Candidatus Buchananbacteria bacterium RIFCSPLOWO2_01_FULL_40_23b]
MKLELKKFGKILNSRPAGREAWLAAKAYLLPLKNNKEKIEVDFSGVLVLSPSWADEFLTPLKKNYSQQVVFLAADNPTVKATLEIIARQYHPS